MQFIFRPMFRSTPALVLVGSLTLFSLSMVMAEDAAPAAVANPALAVSVTSPQAQDWGVTVIANGAISPWQEAIIASEISGLRITELAVDVGDTVKSGQTLATLTTDTIQADIAQAEARVAQATASLAEATTNAARARSLKQSGALPAQQIDQYLTGEATAKANLAMQKAALQAQKIRLNQTRILAPDSGIITSRSASLGAVVQTGTELFRMVRQHKLEWRAEVSGRDASTIQSGQAARLTLPNGESVTGTVRLLAPTLDPNTRNATVYISLPNGSPAKTGMFAEGEILTGATKAMTLPQAAVILRDGNHYVFEVGDDNRVQQRLVKIGRTAQGQTEIRDGISASARVVMSGGGFLNDGDTVQIVDKPISSSGDKP